MNETTNSAYKISETYIKFDLEFTQENKELIKRAYLEYVRTNYSEFFKDIEINAVTIEFDKGSLKAKIVLWALAINTFVANYGSFRSGIKDLISDSQTLSAWITERFKHDPHIADQDIIRSERRLGVPGKLNDLYKRVDSIQRNAANLSPNQVRQRLDEVKQEISDIAVLLEESTRQRFIENFPDAIKNNLPPAHPDDQNVLANKYGFQIQEKMEFVQ